jgi:hypothetical protein
MSYSPVSVSVSVSLVERRGIAPRSLQCESRILLLKYRPSKHAAAGREGIEPSLRGLEARLVTMTLQPM